MPRILLHMHQLRTFIDDRNIFYQTYFNGVQPKYYKGVKEAFVYGNAVDYALKKYYTDEYGKMYDSTDFQRRLSKEDQLKVVGLCQGYIDYYKDEYFHTFKVGNFRVPFGKFLIYASPDLTAYDYGDDFWIIEIKTSAEEGTAIPLDFQTMCYAWASYKWNFKIPKGVIKRTLRKAKIKEKKKETPEQFRKRIMSDFIERPEFYYSSRYMEITKKDILEFEKYLKQICKDLYLAIKSKNKYKFWSKSDTLWK